jgi:hypothetical protein
LQYRKCIELEVSKEGWEDPEKKAVKMRFYRDGKGNDLSAKDLGPEFMVSGVF